MVKIGVDGSVTDLGTLSCSHAEPVVELTCRFKRWWHRKTHGGSEFGFQCVWKDPRKRG